MARTKTCGSFSTRAELLVVPQGYLIGPFLCNIYEMTDVCNFAGDTTFFAYDINLKFLME